MTGTIGDFFARLGLKVDERQWTRGDKLIAGMKRAVIGLGAVLGATSLVKLVNDTASAGAAAVEAAEKTGLTVEAVQELGFAAEQSGSSVDEMNGALTRLGVNLDDAISKGKGPAHDAFKRLGISMNEPIVKARDVDAIFMRVADQLAKIPDASKRNAISMDLLGKSGANLGGLMKEGGVGIDELRKRAVVLGNVISGPAAKALEEFGDQQNEVKAQLKGLRNQAIIALLPTLQSMVAGLSNWIQANRELLASGLQALVRGLAFAFEVLGAVISVVLRGFKFLTEHSELALIALVALGATMLIFKAQSIATALASAAAWVVALAPFVLVAAAIAAITFVVIKLRKHFAEWAKAVVRAVKAVGRFFADFGRGVVRVVTDVVRFLGGIGESIIDGFRRAIEWVVGKFEWLYDQLVAIRDKIVDLFTSIFESVVVDLETGQIRAQGQPAAGEMATRASSAMSRVVGGSAAGAPMRPTSTVPVSAKSVSVSAPTTIQIDAKNADAPEVARIARQTFDENMTRHLVNAQDDTETP